MSGEKTFQFCKAGKIVSKYIFFTTNLLHKKLVLFDFLVVWLMKLKLNKKPKQDFPCKTKINANSYCKKDVKASLK